MPSSASSLQDSVIEVPSSPSPSPLSSSIQKSFTYDVLILSSSTSTCKNFVDRLCNELTKKGVCTIKTVGENIRNGERISDDLIKAIEDSKLYIIVFSENYAPSPRWLDELVKIMECHKMPGHSAYPVFYDVEPTEVRNQEATGKRKGALKEAAGLAGWELKLNTLEHEDKFIKKIVQKISLALFYPVLNKLVETSFAVNVDFTRGSTFNFIIGCLLAFAGIKSQNVTGFPFTTHPNAINVAVTSLLIYASASMAERVFSGAGLDHPSVYAIIARLGRISSLCLFVTSLAILMYI